MDRTVYEQSLVAMGLRRKYRKNYGLELVGGDANNSNGGKFYLKVPQSHISSVAAFIRGRENDDDDDDVGYMRGEFTRQILMTFDKVGTYTGEDLDLLLPLSKEAGGMLAPYFAGATRDSGAAPGGKGLVVQTFIESLFAFKPGNSYYSAYVCRNTLAIETQSLPHVLNLYHTYLTSELQYKRGRAKELGGILRKMFHAEESYLLAPPLSPCLPVMTLPLTSYFPGMGLLQRRDGELVAAGGNVLWESPEYRGIPGFNPETAQIEGPAGGSVTFEVTKHAFSQWLERGPGTGGNFPESGPGNKRKAMEYMVDLMRRSRQVRRQNRGMQVIRHKKPARYFTAEGWIFVVQENPDVLITCYFKGNIRAHGYEEMTRSVSQC